METKTSLLDIRPHDHGKRVYPMRVDRAARKYLIWNIGYLVFLANVKPLALALLRFQN